ncbi:hypothetical protein BY996DRAFT_4605101, partial [Phakopsora pachyrhizi]
LKDETNHTVDDPQNIANSICSASQRATKSVGIATPTYYANLLLQGLRSGTYHMKMVLQFSQPKVELKPQVRDIVSLITSRAR